MGQQPLSILWLLRRSGYLQRICLYSGITAGQQPLSIFWLLRRSSYLQRMCLYSGVAAGQQPLPIFWLLRRSVIFGEFAYILASLWGSSLCLYSGCYGGALIIEKANFADILGIARERFKHVFLLRPMFQITKFDFFCKSGCVEDKSIICQRSRVRVPRTGMMQI